MCVYDECEEHTHGSSVCADTHNTERETVSVFFDSIDSTCFTVAAGMIAAGSESALVHFPSKPPYKMVNNYLLGAVLGEGSQGKVREALHAVTLRRVAIKRLKLQQLRKLRNAEASLRRELAIHRRLKHKHVVELIEYFLVEEKLKVYVVLEHVWGGSLQDVLDGAPGGFLPVGMARRLMRQLFVGLDYVHSQGVVHRDVKPANLLVTADGIVKLADFGSAEELHRYEASDACCKSKGSPAFQAPEVAAGHVTFSGFKVDVWAAGVTLFLLMSGHTPFEGSSLMHLFENIAKGEFEIPPRLRGDGLLVMLLGALLALDQNARLSVRDALSHPWLAPHHEDEAWTERERALVTSVARAQFDLLRRGAEEITSRNERT